MIRCIRRPALAGSILCALAVLHVHAQQRPIDAFFEDFTAAWVRLSPNQATAARYFTGAEQDALGPTTGQLTNGKNGEGVESNSMTNRITRDRMVEVIRELPADATVDDAIERLVFLAKIEEGLAQLDRGEGVPHEEVRRRLGL